MVGIIYFHQALAHLPNTLNTMHHGIPERQIDAVIRIPACCQGRCKVEVYRKTPSVDTRFPHIKHNAEQR